MGAAGSLEARSGCYLLFALPASHIFSRGRLEINLNLLRQRHGLCAKRRDQRRMNSRPTMAPDEACFTLLAAAAALKCAAAAYLAHWIRELNLIELN